MNMHKSINRERSRLSENRVNVRSEMIYRLNPYQKRKLRKLLSKGRTIIPLLQVHMRLYVYFVGVPIAGGRTRSEPNKSAIDLAVKALREKERKKGYSFTGSSSF